MSNQRYQALTEAMDAAGLDAVALVPGPNFRRLFAWDFHLMERPLVVVVPREGPPAAVVPDIERASFERLGFEGDVFYWRDETGHADAFALLGRDFRCPARLGVEGQRMRVFELRALEAAFPGCHLVDAHRAISSIRLLKVPDEIAALRRAIRLSEAALEATLEGVRVGQTETAIEAALIRNLFDAGSAELAFGPIVAAGGNAAQSHAKARPDYRVRPGDALLFDFGGTADGYAADITRTVFVAEVTEEDRALYDTVAAANAAGRAATRAGVSAHDVDDAVQRVLEASPFAAYRRHKTGHGLGLAVHEDPYIMRGNAERLAAGMVFTVEPGLYIPDRLGVRIEDDVVVTDAGHDCLTEFPRTLRLVAC